MTAYRKQCGEAARRGVNTMRTVFGTKVTTDKTGNTWELQRSLSSIPIQGTGADILDLLIDHFNSESEKEFRQYSEEERPYVYFTRHDELRICVKESTVKDYGEEQFIEWMRSVTEHRIDNSTVFHVEIERVENRDISELLIEEDDEAE